MGAFASIPEDCLDRASGWLTKQDFFFQRAVSPAARDAARRAVTRHYGRDAAALRHKYTGLHVVRFRHSPDDIDRSQIGAAPLQMKARPRVVDAMGRVFGAGCTQLEACGTTIPRIVAVRRFITSTNGGLLSLSLHNCAVSPGIMVQMCRAAPNLLFFGGPQYVSTPEASIIAISEACPKLTDVHFSNLGSTLGPAERYERFFPHLETLTIPPRYPYQQYQPTRLDWITEAARATSAKYLNLEGSYITADFVAAVVGTPLGDRVTEFAFGDFRETTIEPEAFLAAARGFPKLEELCIPKGTSIPNAAFYEELARIRTFQNVQILDDGTTNAHVVAFARNNSLKKLELRFLPRIDRGLLDGIISSRSAATLEDLEIVYCGEPNVEYPDDPPVFGCSAFLRLVRACPKLKRLYWQHEYEDTTSGEEEISKILVDRGGEFDLAWC